MAAGDLSCQDSVFFLVNLRLITDCLCPVVFPDQVVSHLLDALGFAFNLDMLPSLLPPGPCNACSPFYRMPLAAVGYLDGTLAIYDLSTQSLRHKCQHEVLPYHPLPLPGGCSLGPAKTSLGAQGLSWGQFPICASPSAPWASPKAATVPAQRMCPRAQPWGLALLSRQRWGNPWGELSLAGVPSPHPVASPCHSRGLCSCCGRRARPWCTPAAWMEPSGSGTRAQGR